MADSRYTNVYADFVRIDFLNKALPKTSILNRPRMTLWYKNIDILRVLYMNIMLYNFFAYV